MVHHLLFNYLLLTAEIKTKLDKLINLSYNPAMLDQGYWLALHALPGIGRVRLSQLMVSFKTGQAAWNATSAQLLGIGFSHSLVNQIMQAKLVLDPQAYYERLVLSKIKWVFLGEADYPDLLSEIPDPPLILYYRGILNWREPTISIVGSRKLTGYGRGVTEQLSQALVTAGVTIVSGLAYGADTIAHQVSVKAKKPTIAVLGSGLYQLYPPENQLLSESIIESGGAIISEYPPEQPPMAGNFPARNRIIAGLSPSTIITEASTKSGSLITAKFALEFGRDVYAVPGQINSEQSRGTNQLLKHGAGMITSVTDLLTDLGLTITPNRSELTSLSALESSVINLLADQPSSADQLCHQLNLPIQQINSCLVKLELTGYITNLGSQIYQKNR